MHAGAITSSAPATSVRNDGHLNHNHAARRDAQTSNNLAGAATAASGLPTSTHEHAPGTARPGHVDVLA